MEIRLDGQRAAVTAGAGGAGLVTAQALEAAGASVFVSDVDDAAVHRLPVGLHGAVVDVADPEQVEDWLAPIAAEGLDILVNNAGIAGPTAPIEDISVDEWRSCLGVDLDAMFYCTRLVVPAMKKAGSGVIVNMTSTAGLMGMPNRSPYVVAKYGVVGLTETLAMELGRDNIRVNAIAPGSINGDRMDRVVAAHARSESVSEEQVRAMYVDGVSMARFVDADEIASMIVYLCSDHGRSISGQIIAIDGNTETLYPRTSPPPNGA